MALDRPGPLDRFESFRIQSESHPERRTFPPGQPRFESGSVLRGRCRLASRWRLPSHRESPAPSYRSTAQTRLAGTRAVRDAALGSRSVQHENARGLGAKWRRAPIQREGYRKRGPFGRRAIDPDRHGPGRPSFSCATRQGPQPGGRLCATNSDCSPCSPACELRCAIACPKSSPTPPLESGGPSLGSYSDDIAACWHEVRRAHPCRGS
jgi:hypothetical protein